MNLAASADATVLDANVLIAICCKEESTYEAAETVFRAYAEDGRSFFAPNVIVAEVLFVLCRKLVDGVLTEAEHALATKVFESLMSAVTTPETGDSELIAKAHEIRGSFGCSRMSDSLYIAYASELASQQTVEMLTFDKGLVNHAETYSSSLTVRLLEA